MTPQHDEKAGLTLFAVHVHVHGAQFHSMAQRMQSHPLIFNPHPQMVSFLTHASAADASCVEGVFKSREAIKATAPI